MDDIHYYREILMAEEDGKHEILMRILAAAFDATPGPTMGHYTARRGNLPTLKDELATATTVGQASHTVASANPAVHTAPLTHFKL